MKFLTENKYCTRKKFVIDRRKSVKLASGVTTPRDCEGEPGRYKATNT